MGNRTSQAAKHERLIMSKAIDDKGRTWHKFTASYHHELDDQALTFEIWAIDFADAVERLEFIKSNGKIDGKLA